MKKTDYDPSSQKHYYETAYDTCLRNWSRKIRAKMDVDSNAEKALITSRVKTLSLESDHKLKIIDLGCGLGFKTKALSKYGDVVGVDQTVRGAKTLFPNLKFIEADIVVDKISGEYDVVVSSEVIEHLRTQDQKAHAIRIQDLMKENNGLLVLTTPNKPIAEKMVSEFHIPRERLQPIENWLDRDSLVSLIQSTLEIESVKSIVHYPRRKYITKHRWLVGLPVYALSCFLPVHKFFLADSSDQGLYLMVTAKKRSSIRKQSSTT